MAWNKSNPLYRWKMKQKRKSSSRRSTARIGTSMARRRKGRFARFGRKAARFGRRATNISTPEGVIIPAAIYGAGRSYLSNLVAPLTSKIPLGGFADEVVMGGLGYLAAKKGSGMVKKIGMAALTIEAASVGNAVASGAIGGMSSNSSSSTNLSFGGWE